ncbi:MAG: hypothetical protein RMM98_17655 [Acidobacteriota bacterium]|nr:hypothetical protein [Blastocatellia bacterium]MDW8241429.1 hypothetical protein [Acidobacteriota bacterium]
MSEMKELKLQSEIERRIGRLVEEAETLISNLKGNIDKIEASQIRNVIAVANSAPHPAIVTNFIRYQMGRSGAPGKAWKESGLGDRVISAIDKTVRNLASEADQAAAFGNVDEVQIRMTRLLLGFMNRRFVYEKEGSK